MALSANKMVSSVDGRPCLVPSGQQQVYSVKTAVHVYRGALVALDADGDLMLAADAANAVPVGVSLDEADNTDGADGDIECTVDIGGCQMEFVHTAGSQTDANKGDVVVADGDDAVDLASGATNDYQIGVITEVKSATVVKVQLLSAAAIAMANVAIADA
jgi:hypothetical protein